VDDPRDRASVEIKYQEQKRDYCKYPVNRVYADNLFLGKHPGSLFPDILKVNIGNDKPALTRKKSQPRKAPAEDAFTGSILK
jgi:hypothetical protein